MKRVIVHPLWSILLIPALSLIYVALNREPALTRNLYTDLDHAIPFVKYFILPYMIWMPFLYLTLIYIFYRDRRTYFHTMAAYTLGVLVCYGIYLIFQTTVPRIELQDTDLVSRMVMWVYRNDEPFNCFPSIHCLSSYLLFRAALDSPAISTRLTVGIGALAWMIILSTMFVKQHVVLDALAGVMLGHVVFSLVTSLSGSNSRNAYDKGKGEMNY